MMARALRRWRLTAVELEDGRLALGGLPDSPEARLSVVMRLLDTLRAQAHSDAGTETMGTLWDIYCNDSWHRGWSGAVTVTRGPTTRQMQGGSHADGQ